MMGYPLDLVPFLAKRKDLRKSLSYFLRVLLSLYNSYDSFLVLLSLEEGKKERDQETQRETERKLDFLKMILHWIRIEVLLGLFTFTILY